MLGSVNDIASLLSGSSGCAANGIARFARNPRSVFSGFMRALADFVLIAQAPGFGPDALCPFGESLRAFARRILRRARAIFHAIFDLELLVQLARLASGC